MFRIYLASILLIYMLGILLLWPISSESIAHKSVGNAYDSICAITTGDYMASGVVLESGYVITAAHFIDRNGNGTIDPEEKKVTLKFYSPEFEVQAEAIATGDPTIDLDVAILKPDKKIPVKGVKLVSFEEYWSLKIGTPIYSIGMQNGEYPGNITDGRIVEMDPVSHSHRNSSTTYYGSSGGGVFKDDKLIGISVAISFGRQQVSIPIFWFNPKTLGRHQVGAVTVSYQVPIANASRHVPASSVMKLLKEKGLTEKVLKEHPVWKPYEPYFAMSGFNMAFIVGLFLVFKLVRRFAA